MLLVRRFADDGDMKHALFTVISADSVAANTATKDRLVSGIHNLFYIVHTVVHVKMCDGWYCIAAAAAAAAISTW